MEVKIRIRFPRIPIPCSPIGWLFLPSGKSDRILAVFFQANTAIYAMDTRLIPMHTVNNVICFRKNWRLVCFSISSHCCITGLPTLHRLHCKSAIPSHNFGAKHFNFVRQLQNLNWRKCSPSPKMNEEVNTPRKKGWESVFSHPQQENRAQVYGACYFWKWR